jgi:phosphoribosyl-ATP pyrophosphohydrolase
LVLLHGRQLRLQDVVNELRERHANRSAATNSPAPGSGS